MYYGYYDYSFHYSHYDDIIVVMITIGNESVYLTVFWASHLGSGDTLKESAFRSLGLVVPALSFHSVTCFSTLLQDEISLG